MRRLRTPSNSSKSWNEDTCLSQDITNAKAKSENSRRITVYSNQFMQLESLVQDAEVHRHTRNTSEVQTYIDTHPELPQHTRTLTNEIKEKIIFHLANGDTAQEAQIREEVNVIRA